jgi:ribonuclease HII
MKEKDTIKYIIGIDEVGRGPIAGPVAVCAFMVKDDLIFKGLACKECKKLPKLKDSKKLSKKQREEWFQYLKVAKVEGFCDFSVSFVSPENIDKHGIAKCIQKALNSSLLNLIKTSELEPSSYKIILDGGLKAPLYYVNQETVIRGDELHPVISMASIMAKVSRDAVMTKYGKEYPGYGFEKHSGYGTKAHYESINKIGFTPIHRRSFIHL